MQTPSLQPTLIAADPRRGTGFLEESPGNSSAMRLMCMISLCTAIGLSVFSAVTSQPYKQLDAKGRATLVFPQRDPQGIYLIYGFLVAAFAPKAIQKFAEQKLPTYNPSQPMLAPTTVMLPQVAAQPVIESSLAPLSAVSAVSAAPPMSAPVPVSPQANGANKIQSLQQRGGL